MAKKKMVLGKDDLLKKEFVEIPERGEDAGIYIRALGGKSLLKYKEKIEELQKQSTELDSYNSVELMAYLVSLVACDEDGNQLFTEEDVRQLAEINIRILMRLSTKALEISGLPTRSVQEVNSHLKNAMQDSSITTSQES